MFIPKKREQLQYTKENMRQVDIPSRSGVSNPLSSEIYDNMSPIKDKVLLRPHGKSITHDYQIGDWEGKNIIRKRPHPDRVVKFFKDFAKDIVDYDVYLWGSWPERQKTWDLDLLLLKRGKRPSTEEMQYIVERGLDVSLKENNFLADIGFAGSKKDVRPFKDIMDTYLKTGKKHDTVGYVYGKEWSIDGEIFKDRLDFKNGVVTPLQNNMIKINSSIPYPKMIQRGQNMFKVAYSKKPMLVYKGRDIHGL